MKDEGILPIETLYSDNGTICCKNKLMGSGSWVRKCFQHYTWPLCSMHYLLLIPALCVTLALPLSSVNYLHLTSTLCVIHTPDHSTLCGIFSLPPTLAICVLFTSDPCTLCTTICQDMLCPPHHSSAHGAQGILSASSSQILWLIVSGHGKNVCIILWVWFKVGVVSRVSLNFIFW